jgi:hypothetical protein
MDEFGAGREVPNLKELVVEASRALAHLNAERLEELALSCEALTRTLGVSAGRDGAALADRAREAVGEMAVFARVLDATQANLNVMKRLRELRSGRSEYGTLPEAGWKWGRTESRHGDN